MASVIVLFAIGVLSLLILIPILLIIDSYQGPLTFDDLAAKWGLTSSGGLPFTSATTASSVVVTTESKFRQLIDPESQLPIHFQLPPSPRSPTTPPLPPPSMQQQQQQKLMRPLDAKQHTETRPLSRLATTPRRGPDVKQRAVLSMAKLIMLRHDKACRRQPRRAQPPSPPPSPTHAAHVPSSRSRQAITVQLSMAGMTGNDSLPPPVMVV